MYKVTVYRFFIFPDEYWVESEQEAEELREEFESLTSSVDIEYIDEGE